MEIWKDVVGYEGLYQVSNLGNVWSNITTRMLKPHFQEKGYARVILRKNNKSYGELIHRLVATAFIENKNNYKCVNHKDENKRNNNANNLEWCTYKYNSTYGTTVERRISKTNYKTIADYNSKVVNQYNVQGSLLRQWKSANECKRELGYDNSAIAKCCRGMLNKAYGYVWRYAEVV